MSTKCERILLVDLYMTLICLKDSIKRMGHYMNTEVVIEELTDLQVIYNYHYNFKQI